MVASPLKQPGTTYYQATAVGASLTTQRRGRLGTRLLNDIS